jgi:type II secretory pathway component PulM
MNRDVNAKEKVLLVILVLIILGFGYYRFVDQPVRKNLVKAEAEYASIQTELTEVRIKIKELQRMQDEIDEITSGGKDSFMPSYNNAKEELALLNDILNESVTQYSVAFTTVTRYKDQIRRDFKLSFTAPDYESMKAVIDKLTGVDYRCMVGDCSCNVIEVKNPQQKEPTTVLAVSATATFFETMVGGTADAGLPPDSSK